MEDKKDFLVHTVVTEQGLSSQKQEGNVLVKKTICLTVVEEWIIPEDEMPQKGEEDTTKGLIDVEEEEWDEMLAEEKEDLWKRIKKFFIAG